MPATHPIPDLKTRALSFSAVVAAFLLLTCLFTVNAPKASGEGVAPWTFVVIGDTRDEHLNTTTGVSPYLRTLAERIAGDQPDLVLHDGDLVNGYYTNASSPIRGNYTAMFSNWKSAMAPLYDYQNGTGTPIYTIRGNHEDGELLTDAALKKAYQDEIGRMMPQNGPPGEEGLTYSFAHNGARFIMLDQYMGDTVIDKGAVNQLWLDKQLADDRGPFTIVMAHTPAFKVCEDIMISPPPNLYNQPAARDRFWNSLADAGVKVYFCGHAHLYCRGSLDGVQQVVVGDCGAGFEPYDPADLMMTPEYPLEKVNSSVHKVGYMLVSVNEANRTIETVQKLYDVDTGQWSIGDHFTIAVGGEERTFDLIPWVLGGALVAAVAFGSIYWIVRKKGDA